MEKPKIKIAKGSRALVKQSILGLKLSLEGQVIDCMGKSLKIEFKPIPILRGKSFTPPTQWFDLSKPKDAAKVTFEKL